LEVEVRQRSFLVPAVAFLFMACAPAATPSPTAEPTAAVFEGDIAVDGERTLHIVCAGSSDPGRPTVVFENGRGPSLGTWSSVVDGIKATHRACAYDRAGVGRSDAALAPRTTQDQVDDLAALLEAAGVGGPIVLVVHSAGGWNAILYTSEHPEQVVGAVLVDVLPPGLEGRLVEVLPPETPDEPAAIHQARLDFTIPRTDPSTNPENLLVADSEVEVLAAPGFGARPTEILWATNTQLKVWPDFPPDLAEQLNAAIDEQLRSVEGLADDPAVTQVDSGHAIQEEQPEVVIEAIRRVLDQLEP
jgi:pimeloyl-ACP methyl ester carboxylesterase